MIAVSSVVIGPTEHGVVRHARAVARAAGTPVARHLAVADARAGVLPAAAVHHWHFTDRLFGADVDEAAATFHDLTADLAGCHVVTLHDVPPATGTARDRRRAAAYRAVAARCAAVVVASHHERRRLVAAGVAGPIAVIPLPVVTLGSAAVPRAGDRPLGRTVGVLGFVYPGKGHADVIAAGHDLPADVRYVALGRASDGHADLAATLQRTAAEAGRDLTITGFLDDACLPGALEVIDVPVVPAVDVSASASVGTWIAAARRPLVARNGYSRELAARHPGLITLYDPDGAGPALQAALDDPASTWRAGPIPACLGVDAVATAHLDVYRGVAR